jgi:hypothetical protein
MLVFPTNISCRVVRVAANIDDNTQDDESDTCYDFDNGEHKFNYSRDSQSQHGRNERSERAT